MEKNDDLEEMISKYIAEKGLKKKCVFQRFKLELKYKELTEEVIRHYKFIARVAKKDAKEIVRKTINAGKFYRDLPGRKQYLFLKKSALLQSTQTIYVDENGNDIELCANLSIIINETMKENGGYFELTDLDIIFYFLSKNLRKKENLDVFKPLFENCTRYGINIRKGTVLFKFIEIMRAFEILKLLNEIENQTIENTKEREQIIIQDNVLKWLQDTICSNGKTFIENATEKPYNWLQNKELARLLLTHPKIKGSLTIAEVERQTPALFFYPKDNKPLELTSPKRVKSIDCDTLNKFLATL